MSSYDEAILAAKALSSKKGLDIQIIKIADVSVLGRLYGNCNRHKLNPCQGACR